MRKRSFHLHLIIPNALTRIEDTMRIFGKITAALSASILFGGLCTAMPMSLASGAEDDLNCAESLIQKTLESGSAWRMCARIHPVKGLVLEKVEFKPATGAYEYSG